MSRRRRWLSLHEYEQAYGPLFYSVPDTRTDPRTCLWCRGALPSKRHSSFCGPDCRDAWNVRYVWFRNRAPVAWRILCRDQFTCQNCGAAPEFTNEHGVVLPTGEGLDVHHIVPVSTGGTDHESNLVTLCKACHMERHGKECS